MRHHFFENLKYFEYELIYIVINNRSNLIVPVLLNSEVKALESYPSFINFGICNIQNPKNIIKKIIQITMKNIYNEPILIKDVLTPYNDEMFEFIFHPGYEKIVLPGHSETLGYAIYSGGYSEGDDENEFLNKYKT